MPKKKGNKGNKGKGNKAHQSPSAKTRPLKLDESSPTPSLHASAAKLRQRSPALPATPSAPQSPTARKCAGTMPLPIERGTQGGEPVFAAREIDRRVSDVHCSSEALKRKQLLPDYQYSQYSTPVRRNSDAFIEDRNSRALRSYEDSDSGNTDTDDDDDDDDDDLVDEGIFSRIISMFR